VSDGYGKVVIETMEDGSIQLSQNDKEPIVTDCGGAVAIADALYAHVNEIDQEESEEFHDDESTTTSPDFSP